MDQWLRFGYTEPWGKLINHDLVKKYNIKFVYAKPDGYDGYNLGEFDFRQVFTDW